MSSWGVTAAFPYSPSHLLAWGGTQHVFVELKQRAHQIKLSSMKWGYPCPYSSGMCEDFAHKKRSIKSIIIHITSSFSFLFFWPGGAARRIDQQAEEMSAHSAAGQLGGPLDYHPFIPPRPAECWVGRLAQLLKPSLPPGVKVQGRPHICVVLTSPFQTVSYSLLSLKYSQIPASHLSICNLASMHFFHHTSSPQSNYPSSWRN